MNSSSSEKNKEYIIEAETVEKAYKKALQEYDLDIDKYEVEIIQEESKGFIDGLLGRKKKAKVRFRLKEENRDTTDYLDKIAKEHKDDIEREQEYEYIKITTKEIITDILNFFSLNPEVSINIKNNTINISLTGQNLGLLIGKNGKNLYALQFLLAIILRKKFSQELFIKLDIDNYRKRREKYLIKLANEKAKEALRDKKDIILQPMLAFERKIIHLTIKKYRGLKTVSEGQYPNRKVKILYVAK